MLTEGLKTLTEALTLLGFNNINGCFIKVIRLHCVVLATWSECGRSVNNLNKLFDS